LRSNSRTASRSLLARDHQRHRAPVQAVPAGREGSPVPDDTALRRAIDRQRENDAIESMMDAAGKQSPFTMRAESLEHLRADMAEADRLDTEPYGR